MRWSLTALVALSALSVVPSTAGARPVAGGVYNAPLVTEPLCSGCSIDLLVAPDGRSLDRGGSRAGAPCHGGDAEAGASTTAPRGTRIDRRGRFAWRASGLAVEGRFSARGSVATGTVRFLPGRACDPNPWPFRARLVRRPGDRIPGQPPPCREGGAADFSLEIAYRGASCQSVARLVFRWSNDRRCVSRAGRARACRVAGYRCGPIDGGLLRALAGAECVRAGGRVELIVRHVCATLPVEMFVLFVTKVTTDCATAERVGRAWARRRGCRGRVCRVEGWICRFERRVGRTRCARPQRPRHVLELALEIVLEG
jgi:hypothetical protein